MYSYMALLSLLLPKHISSLVITMYALAYYVMINVYISSSHRRNPHPSHTESFPIITDSKSVVSSFQAMYKIIKSHTNSI